MKKLMLFILSLMLVPELFANVVTMEVNPNRPIVGETFQLVFRIKTTDSEEPYISFDRGTADVIGKSDRGVSINTTIINGKFSTTRTLTHVYELVATRPGPLRISNIKIEIGGKEYKVRSKTITILREAVRAKDFFLQAEPSKTEVFVGEGIDVRYYLYTKVPIVSQEVKVFPKLDKFIKRFHMINREQTTTVEYMGEIYKKSLKYSARIYPEQIGRAFIDPLKLRVQYSSSNRKSPFGAFGLRMREYRTRSIQSKKIEIKVKPIPSVNVPNDFTGLVGEHDFEFKLNKDKYLVNEVVEAKLNVTGPGALENYAAPKVYTHPGLEEFDTKAEFSEVSKVIGKKSFDYTFLARDKFTVPPRDLSLSTFDPETESFVTKRVSLPALSVQGGIVKPTGGGHSKEEKPSEEPTQVSGSEVGLVAPTFIGGFDFRRVNFIKWINFGLIGLILFLIYIPLGSFIKEFTSKSELERKIIEIQKKGMNYHRLYAALSELPDENGHSINDRLDSSNLSEEAKEYFLKNLEICEKGDFSGISGGGKNVKMNKKYFSELVKAVQENSFETDIQA